MPALPVCLSRSHGIRCRVVTFWLLFIIMMMEGCDSSEEIESDVMPPDQSPRTTQQTLKPVVPPTKLESIENSQGMTLVKVPAGEFLMGSPDTEKHRSAGEFQRMMTIEEPFYIGTHEVTQEQYESVMGENQSADRGPTLPVTNVSIDQVDEFCRRLSEAEGETYRLPTEAEWEYACRAGTTTAFYFGDQCAAEDANFHLMDPYGIPGPHPKRHDAKLRPVGSYAPNPFGLYDTHGNAWEWCLDRMRGSTHMNVIRGGSAKEGAAYARSAYRHSAGAAWEWLSFRVVRTLTPTTGEMKSPLAHGLDEVDLLTEDDLITELDAALAKPARKLLSPVVIFPVVDSERHVRDDGVGFSSVASFLTAYTPHRRMQISLPNVRHRLLSAGCFKPAVKIDDETVNLCLSTLGIDEYVLPVLTGEGDEWLLTLRVHNVSDQESTDETVHTLTLSELVTIPNLIAREVLEHLNADLKADEIAYVMTPQLSEPQDATALTQFVYQYAFGEDNADLTAFLDRNPLCLPAWELFVFESNPPGPALEKFEQTQDELHCERFPVQASVRENSSSDSFMRALEYAPDFPNDTYYFSALAFISKDMHKPELTGCILDAWRKADPTYTGGQQRADFLVQWAWQARGNGWAKDVTVEGWRLFGERISIAQQELEQALEINPRGWEAHSVLITVGMTAGAGEDYIRRHFEDAIALRPRCHDPYSRRFQTVQSRWGGSRQDLLAFARLCFETEFWEENIPEIGRLAIVDLITVPRNQAVMRTAIEAADLWETILVYIETLEAHDDPSIQKYGKSLRAEYGAYGGHFEDAFDAVQYVEKEGPDNRVFTDGYNLDFVRDLIYAKAGEGQKQIIAKVSALMDVGDLDGAEATIAEVTDDREEIVKDMQRIGAAIKLGRKLKETRSITLSPEDITQTFLGIDESWSVEDGDLICQLDPGNASLILFPFGLEQARISGTIKLEQAPEKLWIHTHTRALRDSLHFFYELNEYHVSKYRGNTYQERARPVNNQIDFAIARGPDQDQLQPIEHVEWTADVIEYAPSGFGIELLAEQEKPASIRISDVRIELTD